MGKLDEFLGRQEAKPTAPAPEGIEWFASVNCQMCGEPVDEQTLYSADRVLVWTCTQGHKSFMENYSVF